MDTTKINIDKLGIQLVVTDFGAVGDGLTLNTESIQKAIDEAARKGGGVVVIPEGLFLTGALFFKPGTHLYVSEGAVLLGSDTIVNFPIMPSRMEGQSIDYFPAVVNAYGVDGFTITGKGTIDGNAGPKTRNTPTSKYRAPGLFSFRTAKMYSCRMSNCITPDSGQPTCIAATM